MVSLRDAVARRDVKQLLFDCVSFSTQLYLPEPCTEGMGMHRGSETWIQWGGAVGEEGITSSHGHSYLPLIVPLRMPLSSQDFISGASRNVSAHKLTTAVDDLIQRLNAANTEWVLALNTKEDTHPLTTTTIVIVGLRLDLNPQPQNLNPKSTVHTLCKLL
jgi:hypothetical protein